MCVCIILSFSLSLGSHCQLVSFLQKSESMSVSSGLSRSGPHLGQPHCSSLYLLLNFLSVWRGMSALLSVPLLCQCVLVLTISDLWESLSYIGFFVINHWLSLWISNHRARKKKTNFKPRNQSANVLHLLFELLMWLSHPFLFLSRLHVRISPGVINVPAISQFRLMAFQQYW